MTIQEARQSVNQRRQEIAQARQDVSNAEASIPQTTQQQLRGQTAPGGLAGRNYQIALADARGNVEQYKQMLAEQEQVTETYNQELEDYQKTDQGKLQYAREEKLKPKPVYGRAYKGASLQRIGDKYQTPYGEVVDYSRKREIIKDAIAIEKYESEQIEKLGYTSRNDYLKKTVISELEKKGISVKVDNSTGEMELGNVPENLKNLQVKTLLGPIDLKIRSAQGVSQKAAQSKELQGFNSIKENSITTPSNKFSSFATGFGIVEARPQDISSLGMSRADGLDVPTRAPNGNNIRLGGDEQSGDSNRSSGRGFLSGFKEAVANKTGVPVGEVQPAPTLGETYIKVVSRDGPIKGTLSFVGATASDFAERKGLLDVPTQVAGGKKTSYSTYEPFRELVKVAPSVAVYASPAGPFIGLASGVESVIMAPTTTGKALGVVEAGVGLYGLKAQVSGIRVSRQLRELENVPTQIKGHRIEGEKGGIDIIYGIKKTPDATSAVKLQQPFFKTGGRYTVYESGRGTAYLKRGDQLSISRFESGGKVAEYGANPRLVRVRPKETLQTSIDAQVGSGNFYTKELVKADVKVSSSFEPFTQKWVGKAKGIIEKGANVAEHSPTITLSRQGGGKVINVISGKAVKKGYDIDRGAIYIRAKPEVYGQIKKVEPFNDGNMFFSSGDKKLSQVRTAPVLSADVVEAQIKKQIALAKQNNPIIPKTLPLKTTVGISPQRQQGKTESVLSLKAQQVQVSNQNTQQQAAFVTIQKQRQTQELLNRQGDGSTFIQNLAPQVKQRSIEKQTQELLNRQRNRTRSATVQTQKNAQENTNSKGALPFSILKRISNATEKTQSRSLSEKFSAYGRRFGKDFEIGSFGSKREAEASLVSFLKGTLGRSGYLTQGGSKVRADLNSIEFGSAKRDALRVVQKAKYSLGSRAEVSEIKMFQKKRGGSRARPF